MVATVIVEQLTVGADGGGGSVADTVATSTRFQTQDDFDITNLTHPIPIPSAGFNYSFWIHVYLRITVAGGMTRINNVQLYCDGAIGFNYGAGGELRLGHRDAGDIGCPMDASYEVATGTVSTTGHTIEDGANGHTYYNGQAVKTIDIENYVTGARATIDSTNHAGVGKCKAAVMQVKLDTLGNGAVQGVQTDETITFAYDEI